MAQVIPVRTVDDRINGDPLQRHAVPNGRLHLLMDLPEPGPASGSEMTGLPDEEWALVALIDLIEQLVQRHPAVVARVLFPAQTDVWMLPLVGMVIVQAHNI